MEFTSRYSPSKTCCLDSNDRCKKNVQIAVCHVETGSFPIGESTSSFNWVCFAYGVWVDIHFQPLLADMSWLNNMHVQICMYKYACINLYAHVYVYMCKRYPIILLIYHISAHLCVAHSIPCQILYIYSRFPGDVPSDLPHPKYLVPHS